MRLTAATRRPICGRRVRMRTCAPRSLSVSAIAYAGSSSTSSTAAKADTFSRLQEGQHAHGAVKNITDYGVFVDLGGVDGLLHINDVPVKREKIEDYIPEDNHSTRVRRCTERNF